MKNHFTRNIRILTKNLELSSLIDLTNTRYSIWNFMISTQYLMLDEERSSNAELIASWASFRQVYIDTTDCWMKYLALWIWFTSTVAVCRPDVSIDVLPRSPSIPARATKCPFTVNNFNVKCSKQSKDSNFFRWIILLRASIGLSKKSTAATSRGFKVFMYSMQSFIR